MTRKCHLILPLVLMMLLNLLLVFLCVQVQTNPILWVLVFSINLLTNGIFIYMRTKYLQDNIFIYSRTGSRKHTVRYYFMAILKYDVLLISSQIVAYLLVQGITKVALWLTFFACWLISWQLLAYLLSLFNCHNPLPWTILFFMLLFFVDQRLLGIGWHLPLENILLIIPIILKVRRNYDRGFDSHY